MAWLFPVGFIGLIFYLIFVWATVNQVECQGISDKQKRLLEPILSQSLSRKPIFFITQLNIQNLFDKLYLWEAVSFKKVYPKKIVITCRQLNNLAYLNYVDASQLSSPISLADWYRLGQTIPKLKSNHQALLIFQDKQAKLSIINNPIQTQDRPSRIVFFANVSTFKPESVAWPTYYWLNQFDSKKNHNFNVFIDNQTILIKDLSRQTFYLLLTNALPQPEALLEFINQQSQIPKIIDWRLKRIIILN